MKRGSLSAASPANLFAVDLRIPGPVETLPLRRRRLIAVVPHVGRYLGPGCARTQARCFEQLEVRGARPGDQDGSRSPTPGNGQSAVRYRERGNWGWDTPLEV